MSLVVIDASVLVMYYTAKDDRRERAASRLASGNALFAPAHLDAEVVSALRGMVKGQPALLRAIPDALEHLISFPVRRMPLELLVRRMWALRHNLTSYDAAYVALAEQIDATLVTGDAKLAGATGPECKFDLL